MPGRMLPLAISHSHSVASTAARTASLSAAVTRGPSGTNRYSETAPSPWIVVQIRVSAAMNDAVAQPGALQQRLGQAAGRAAGQHHRDRVRPERPQHACDIDAAA